MDAAPSSLRAVYLSLEALVPGQASHTHVRTIADGLGAHGIPTTLIAQEIAPGARRPILARLALFARLTLAGLHALRQADVAYVRAHPFALAFAFGARLMGKPVVHEINGRTDDIGVTYGLPAALTGILRAMQHRQYRRAAALVAVTPGLAEWATGIVAGTVPVHVVPNGADGTTFRPDAPLEGEAIAGPYVLFFGGLVAWHGLATMLAATREDDWPEGVRLIVVGDGPGRDELAAAVSQRIIAAGYRPRTEVAGLAARALGVLCPIEGHGARAQGGVAPLKLFEGMASGRPVIATDLPFQGDLVREVGCGLVIPAGDTKALAQAVARLAADPAAADAMGRAGRHAVETRFDWRYRVVDVAMILRGSCARAS